MRMWHVFSALESWDSIICLMSLYKFDQPKVSPSIQLVVGGLEKLRGIFHSTQPQSLS